MCYTNNCPCENNFGECTWYGETDPRDSLCAREKSKQESVDDSWLFARLERLDPDPDAPF